MASIKVESPSVVYDELIGGTAIATITKNISISAGNALERGAVLDENGARLKLYTVLPTGLLIVLCCTVAFPTGSSLS